MANIKTYRWEGIELTINWDSIKPGAIELVGDQIIIHDEDLVREIVRQVEERGGWPPQDAPP